MRKVKIYNWSEFIIGLIFFVMGAFVISIGAYNAISQIAPSDYKIDKGSAIDSNEVEFEVDGKTYKIEVSANKFYIGEVVDIKYDPDNPNKCKVVEDNTVAVVVAVLGGLLFASVGFMIVKRGISFEDKNKSIFGEIE